MNSAEQALARFKQVDKTRSMSQAVKEIDSQAFGSKVDDLYTCYHFSDGSRIMTKGRGRNYQVWKLDA